VLDGVLGCFGEISRTQNVRDAHRFYDTIRQMSGQHMSCTRRIVRGIPTDTSSRRRRKSGTGADLIMMPTYGMGSFRRHLIGSVTAKVLHDVACPVWTAAHVETQRAPSRVAVGDVVRTVTEMAAEEAASSELRSGQ
jgi:hypothetical protein